MGAVNIGTDHEALRQDSREHTSKLYAAHRGTASLAWESLAWESTTSGLSGTITQTSVGSEGEYAGLWRLGALTTSLSPWPGPWSHRANGSEKKQTAGGLGQDAAAGPLAAKTVKPKSTTWHIGMAAR